MDEQVLLSAIAKKNGIVLSPKDPIMIVYTMIDVLSAQYQEATKESLNHLQSNIEQITLNWKESISQQSKIDIDKTIEQNQEQIKKIIYSFVNETENILAEQIKTSCANLYAEFDQLNKSINDASNKKINETKNIALLNLFSSLIVMFSILIMVFKFTFS